MASSSSANTRILHFLGALGVLAVVGYADFLTGYEITFFVFYLIPILYVLRFTGLGAAFVMAVLGTTVWVSSNYAAGQRYSDFITPVWNTTTRFSIFTLFIILFSNRTHLTQMVSERTKSLEQEIRERSRLEQEILKIAEAEQRRIGHDLHDSLGQHLTATALAGKVLAKKLASGAPIEPAVANRLVSLMEEAIEMTRGLARTLHPIELGANGLVDGLQNLATNLSQAFNVSCQFKHSGNMSLKDPQAGIHLYRIAQEAATNAIRHGRAQNLLITLDVTNESFMLTVADDGKGLPLDAHAKQGMGLRIMAYRASIIGASFSIQNLPSGGTRAVCVSTSNLTETDN